jgi:hypothetical protein
MTNFSQKYGAFYDKFKAWNKQEFIQKKTGMRCMVCKEKFPFELFAFHHLDPSTKKFSLKVAAWKGMKGPCKRTLDEAEKCAVLCHNCHALEHVALRNGESLINDQKAYARYRNHRVTKPIREECVDDRDEGPEQWVQEELQLPTPTD